MENQSNREVLEKYTAGKQEYKILDTERIKVLQSLNEFNMVRIHDETGNINPLIIQNHKGFSKVLDQLAQLEGVMAELAAEVNRNADICGEEKIRYETVDLTKF